MGIGEANSIQLHGGWDHNQARWFEIDAKFAVVESEARLLDEAIQVWKRASTLRWLDSARVRAVIVKGGDWAAPDAYFFRLFTDTTGFDLASQEISIEMLLGIVRWWAGPNATSTRLHIGRRDSDGDGQRDPDEPDRLKVQLGRLRLTDSALRAAVQARLGEL